MFDSLAWRRECYERYLLDLDDDEDLDDEDDFWEDTEDEADTAMGAWPA